MNFHKKRGLIGSPLLGNKKGRFTMRNELLKGLSEEQIKKVYSSAYILAEFINEIERKK